MLFTIVCNESQKYFYILDEDSTFKREKGESIIGQFEGEENKEQALNMIWKLRKDLKWRG
jgi:hypothetical protein